jgi:hypothetical protein
MRNVQTRIGGASAGRQVGEVGAASRGRVVAAVRRGALRSKRDQLADARRHVARAKG